MKTTLVALLVFVTAMTVGFVLFQQNRSRAEAQARAARAELRLREAEAEAAGQEARNQREQARLSEANARLAEKARLRVEPSSRPANARGATNPPGAKPNAGFASVLKDPEMKEVMRKQGREAVAKQVKQLLTTHLIQQLGLNADQAARLKELVTRKISAGFDFMVPVMTGELDETGLAELGRQTKAALADLDHQIKNFLGDEAYPIFETQERSQSDRERASKFASRLGDRGQVLDPETQRQLVSLMQDERRHFNFAIDYEDTSKIDFEHFHDFYSEDKFNRYFAEVEELNERILQRAQTILAPEQADEFREALKNHLQQSKYVVRTTNALLGQRAAK